MHKPLAHVCSPWKEKGNRATRYCLFTKKGRPVSVHKAGRKPLSAEALATAIAIAFYPSENGTPEPNQKPGWYLRSLNFPKRIQTKLWRKMQYMGWSEAR